MYGTWGRRGQNLRKICQRLKWTTPVLENARIYAPEQLEFDSEQLRFFDIIYTPDH